MRPVLLCCILTILSTSACLAQRSAFTIDDLGRQWSGATEPECEQYDVDSLLPAHDRVGSECEWLQRAVGEEIERVWDLRDESGSVLTVFWSRPFGITEEAQQAVDSLDQSLESHGFQRRECEADSTPQGRFYRTFWERGPMAVQLMKFVLPDSSGMLNYMAVDDKRVLLDSFPCGDP